MAMSKKDFIALADELRGAEVLTNADTVELADDILGRLCRFMQAQNPRFMEGRWRSYLAGDCGPGGGSVKKGAR